ncbi:MAG: response regulator transcription factor [Lachnospiraceae bacterium]|nr:response regulator transcription factor [Lachnospiraceae bacterium]MBQ2466779.1 response regulator transcription factor [Lachnospiraceae bacterium]MBQ2504036.1 response regulator transcription factor [Lachnospiraceae bacterium]MBQ5385715.1 response regulator transcription factor [Lachnospiraceae bacterium]
MQQILIVEDDTTLNQGLCKALADENRKTVSCENIADAKAQLALGTVSLVLLDINLPDGNGIEFLRAVKAENGALPVILVSANDTDADIVAGLEQGADDYITKPFSLSVLRARVNTQLRKVASEPSRDVYEDDTYRLDFHAMQFAYQGTLVELSKTEQKLLRILVENAGRVVKREQLIDAIWTDGAEYVDENALSVAVKRIRDKLDASECIKTVYGLGYRWERAHE